MTRRYMPGEGANPFLNKLKPEKVHRCLKVRFTTPVDQSEVDCTCGQTVPINVWGLHAPRLAVAAAHGEGKFYGYRTALVSDA